MFLIKKYIIILSVFISLATLAQDYRYTNTLFPSSSISENVIYQTNLSLNAPYTVESNTSNLELKMDIFTPEGDTNLKKPAIILAHSGGFLLGNKNNDDMMAFCDSLAKKGYVTATIDYRLGFNLITNVNMHGTRAVYRGIQDGMAAVRYLRANASDYNIDENKVYFIGSSAGSFIGLHSIYMDDTELPSEINTTNYVNATPPFSHTAPDLGPLNIGDNLNFNGKPDALVALWGAIQNTNLINTTNDNPVFLVHGGDDAVVPFEIGSPFGYPLLNDTYGSNEINNRLESIGITGKETYFIADGEHEFYGTDNGTWSNGSSGNEYWDIIFEKITTFLWKQHKPTANFQWTPGGESSVEGTVNFEDLSSDATNWLWDFGDGTTSTAQNPTHIYDDLETYQVTLYIENDILSWDEKTIEINTSLSTTEDEILDFSYYPNPTTGYLNFALQEYYNSIKIELYDLKGLLIQEDNFTNSKDVTIDINHIAKGVYFVLLKKENKTYPFKIIKQ